MQASQTTKPGSARVVASVNYAAIPYLKVTDDRKRPIRGLWVRNQRYYVRINVEEPVLKYPGWIGLLSDDSRYVHRWKSAESQFLKNGLAEYAEVFKTVCLDTVYSQFPSE